MVAPAPRGGRHGMMIDDTVRGGDGKESSMWKLVPILFALALGAALASCGSTRDARDIVDDCSHQAFCGGKRM